MTARRWLVPAVLLVLAGPLALPAQQPAGAPGAAPQVSQPAYRVWIDFNQRVQMRDGVALSADVYRPDTAGRFPVVLSRTPYTKTGALKAGPELPTAICSTPLMFAASVADVALVAE